MSVPEVIPLKFVSFRRQVGLFADSRLFQKLSKFVQQGRDATILKVETIKMFEFAMFISHLRYKAFKGKVKFSHTRTLNKSSDYARKFAGKKDVTE